MTQTMNPLKVADTLQDTYLRYLETSFFLKDRSLRNQFIELLRDKTQPPLVRRPILEISPGFDSSCTLSELVEKGLISHHFSKLGMDAFERPLYKHQENVLCKAVSEKRNLVIATGTGSGKTECFLYPILNHLFAEMENGTLSQKGVRALLLYPMNALANDQIARLREIARVFPEITFGRYTGETEQEYEKARKKHLIYHTQAPLENELISRDQMQENPPHILFTNYAMLEYLLIRPNDSRLFTGGKWGFLVLDEVHTYSGALGAEIAMLLRRLKERVVHSESGRLQCMGTSATLGAGEQDYPKIAAFARDLFGENFTEMDVIGPAYKRLTQAETTWGAGSSELYAALRKIIFDEQNFDLEALHQTAAAFVPGDPIGKAYAAAQTIQGEKKAQCQAFLYELLQGDEKVQRLRSQLDENRALPLDTIKHLDTSQLLDLVALGAVARMPGSSVSLIPARYHIMARAISGVYAWFDAQNQLRLISKRAKKWPSGGMERAVFELASCNRCGEVMLVGEKKEENGLDYLRQPPGIGDDPIVSLVWYALKSAELSIDEDEWGEAEKKFQAKLQFLTPKKLCRICGRLDDSSTFAINACHDHPSDPIEIYEIVHKPWRETPRICPSCLNNHGTVASRVLTGKEIPVAVLATALYQQVPESPQEQERFLPGGGRKLMMFSDSRQDAAFFAPFMDNTYNKFKQRRYLVQALEQEREHSDLEDWADRVRRQAEAAGQWDEDFSPQKRRREAQSWVLREWIATDRRLALEGAGVVRFFLRKPKNFSELPMFSQAPWSLHPDDQWSLVQILLDTLRYQGIVSFGDFRLDHSDEIFKPRNVACYLRGANSNPKKNVYAWEPAEHRTNKRLDYLYRLLIRQDLPREDAQKYARQGLREIWRAIAHPNGPLSKLFEDKISHSREADLRRLKPDWWQVRLSGDADVFRCETCGTVSSIAVKRVCPLTNCNGNMQPYPHNERVKNHYHSLFTTMTPVPLKVEEHTAQLSKENAFQNQQDFIAGKVNMLSCTTTFEMGVDVGDLQCVFMRNMPPNPGNYVQRAGRAGRRADGAAIIVTYAQRRSHDYAYFDRWEHMVNGAVTPPVIHINNDKIARRHVHAEALAVYYQEHRDAFADKVESLFDPDNTQSEDLFKFLCERPPLLEEKLKRIFPKQLHNDLGLDDWQWLSASKDDEDAWRECFEKRLDNARVDVHGDWKELENAKNKASKNEDFKGAGNYARQLKTLKWRSLLSKLGTHGLMPKYGFPTEVVELKVRSSSRAADQVELARDMKLALSEFAPGNQVVANGMVWISQGINLPTGDRRLHEYRYWNCHKCRFFEAEDIVATDSEENSGSRTCHCGNDLESKRYVFPEFGFTTAAGPGEKVGESRPPMKTYSDVFFYGAEKDKGFIQLPSSPAFSFHDKGQGWIYVINNNREKGFFVCQSCGFVFNENPYFSKEKKNAHKKPWATDKECPNKKFENLALGYRYRTDVLELRPPDVGLGTFKLQNRKEYHSLWLSILYALNNAACRSLKIDERDLGACLNYQRHEYPNFVFFDTAPGGAGFVRKVKDNFDTVVKEALNVVDCGYCAEDSSCIACLRTYYNQRDHNILSRGLARQYLDLLMKRV
jgi:superfamily II DNA/RNA helicase